MEIKITLPLDMTFEKYQELNRFFLNHIGGLRKRNMIFGGLFMALACYSIYLYFYSGNPANLMMAALCALVPMIRSALIRMGLVSRGKKTWQAAFGSHGSTVITQQFYDDRLQQHYGEDTAKIPYGAVMAGYETGNYIFWQIAKNQCVMIDKSACTQEQLSFISKRVKLTRVVRY